MSEGERMYESERIWESETRDVWRALWWDVWRDVRPDVSREGRPAVCCTARLSIGFFQNRRFFWQRRGKESIGQLRFRGRPRGV